MSHYVVFAAQLYEFQALTGLHYSLDGSSRRKEYGYTKKTKEPCSTHMQWIRIEYERLRFSTSDEEEDERLLVKKKMNGINSAWTLKNIITFCVINHFRDSLPSHASNIFHWFITWIWPKKITDPNRNALDVTRARIHGKKIPPFTWIAFTWLGFIVVPHNQTNWWQCNRFHLIDSFWIINSPPFTGVHFEWTTLKRISTEFFLRFRSGNKASYTSIIKAPYAWKKPYLISFSQLNSIKMTKVGLGYFNRSKLYLIKYLACVCKNKRKHKPRI